MIKIANIKRHEPYDLYIGRKNKWLDLEGSKWGNPNPLEREADRESNLAQYKIHILNSPELYNSLYELDELTLGCYCSPNKKCHGDVLRLLREEQKINELFN